MKKQIIVAPSLLAADFLHLEDELTKLRDNGIKYLHFDVMDGHFVPNISFGFPLLEALKDHHELVKDVHIMIADPLTYGPQFAKAGADIVTFHLEAVEDSKVETTIKAIKQAGAKVGLAIKPGTEVEKLIPYIHLIDLALVMSVEPGFGGQKFLDSSLKKIKYLRDYIDKKNLNVLLEVDGGINGETNKLVKEAGVDIVVAGSYLFGKSDIGKRIRGMIND